MIARELGCGCVMGGDVYDKYSKIVNEIERDAAKEVEHLKKQRDEALSSAWLKMQAQSKEVK